MENPTYHKPGTAPWSKYPYSHSSIIQSEGGLTPAAQLPAKYVQLPSIGSPQPTIDNQMVPYGSKSGNLTGRSSLDALDTEDKAKQIETRLAVAEKSNRALLEEVVRLQTELKSSARRNEDILREERNARTQLEVGLRTSNDLIAQMNARIRNTEEKVQEEKLALNSLVNHTKSVEQAVLGSQQELLSKKDTQSSQLQEVKTNLEEALTSKSNLERMCYSLMDDVRQLKARVESQGSELQTATSELKHKTRKLEEEQRVAVGSIKQQGDSRQLSEQNTSLLRGQIENRLVELRDVILDLRTKQDGEIDERRALEQRVQGRLNDVSAAVAQQNMKREESLHTRDIAQREKEHEATTDKLKLQNKMTEMLEEMNKKLMSKEMKLREEAQEKFLQLEKILNQEQEARLQFEKSMRDENDKRLTSLKHLEDEEISSLREAIKNDRGRNRDTIQKLDESISLLEKQVLENKKGVEKVMAAEIKSRKHHEKSTQGKLDSVQEKLQVATATLQQAIGGINAQVTSHDDQLRREMKTMLEDAEQARIRALADMDARLTSLKGKMGMTEDMVEAKIAAASSVLGQNLRERLESVSLWQDMTNGTVQDFNRTVQKLSDQVYRLEEKQKLVKSETNNRIDSEADHRLRDVTALQTQIAELGHSSSRSPRAPTNTDIAVCQQSIRKLAESIQTVKTVLGMKIQSEQKLRLESVEDLSGEVEKLRDFVFSQHGFSVPVPDPGAQQDPSEDRGNTDSIQGRPQSNLTDGGQPDVQKGDSDEGKANSVVRNSPANGDNPVSDGEGQRAGSTDQQNGRKSGGNPSPLGSPGVKNGKLSAQGSVGDKNGKLSPARTPSGNNGKLSPTGNTSGNNGKLSPAGTPSGNNGKLSPAGTTSGNNGKLSPTGTDKGSNRKPSGDGSPNRNGGKSAEPKDNDNRSKSNMDSNNGANMTPSPADGNSGGKKGASPRNKVKNTDGNSGTSEQPPQTAKSEWLLACIQTGVSEFEDRTSFVQDKRVEEVNDLHIQVVRLKAMVEPLVNDPPQPRLFIKDPDVTDRKQAEKSTSSINKWSIYTAYRWLDWKSKWCYVAWRKAAREAGAPQGSDSPLQSPGHSPTHPDPSTPHPYTPDKETPTHSKPLSRQTNQPPSRAGRDRTPSIS